MVYVQNKEGKPLMPTIRYGKVRKMLKNGFAKIVQYEPFTIKLNYSTPEFIQPVSLGIDAGFRHIGISATTKEKELYASEVSLRTDIVELIYTRKKLRHDRRYRNVRYRKARFNNRKKCRLTPSVENRIQAHLWIIASIYKILPISSLIIEVAQFDTQRIKNPNISGKQYQEGEQKDFWNTREYVLYRDRYTCQHCKGKSGDSVLNVHHIESRKTGGDSPGNLITLCETCHKQYHKGSFNLNVKRTPSLKDAAAMSVMRWEIYNRSKHLYPNVHITYGYITKYNRIRYGLGKSHISDARCISKNFNAEPAREYYILKQTRRHNRQIHKFNIIKGGKRKSNQAPFKVRGFCLFDKILFNNIKCFIYGRRQRGYFLLKTIEGKTIHTDAPCNKIKLLQRSKRFLIDKRVFNKSI